jgi:predicted MFS family arabinose efflux permease
VLDVAHDYHHRFRRRMKGSRRLLAFISVAMVVDTAAYATITPLLPQIAAEHDLSKSLAGLLAAAYAIGTFTLSLPAAWLASRIGPKRTVLGALALLAVASVAFGLAATPGALIAARLLQGVGAAAIWAGALAWVVAVTPRERRAEAIGAALGAAIAGALGGPALGAAAAAIGTGIVFGSFVLLPLGLIVTGWRLPGPQPRPSGTLQAVRAAVAEPRMRQGIWLMALPSAAFGVINVIVTLRLATFGAGAIVIGAIFLSAVLLEAIASPVAGRLADRRGALWPAGAGLVAGGIALALLPLPRSAVPLAALVIVTAPLLGLLWTPAMAVLTDGAEARGVDPAFGFGLANMAWGVGAAIGGGGGGALADATSDAVPLLLLALAMLGAATALRPRRRQR